jgi:magnesium-transporting ATPase (P-type)
LTLSGAHLLLYPLLQVRVLRNGREQALPVAQVLVGDLLLVETGDILCTDGLLVAGADVK